MRGNSLSCWLLAITLFATVSVGCRAPYPTYNPYGVYGNPCVPPPGTGVYNPTGQPNQYYQGAPNTGVLPPNPYGAPAGYPTGLCTTTGSASELGTNPRSTRYGHPARSQ